MVLTLALAIQIINHVLPLYVLLLVSRRKVYKICRFFSLQADGTTDASNTEVELFLALYFDSILTDSKVHVCNVYFSLNHLGSGTAEGLFDSLKKALRC